MVKNFLNYTRNYATPPLAVTPNINNNTNNNDIINDDNVNKTRDNVTTTNNTNNNNNTNPAHNSVEYVFARDDDEGDPDWLKTIVRKLEVDYEYKLKLLRNNKASAIPDKPSKEQMKQEAFRYAVI